MNNQINQTIRKTWSYWYIDGLTEIAGGVIILLIAALYSVLALPVMRPIAALAIGVGQPAIILAGALAANRIVGHYKARLTYPRTGYVAYPKRSPKRRWLAAILSAVISIGVIIALGWVLPHTGMGIIPIMTGFFIFLFLAFMGWRFGVTRFYIVGALTLAAGLVSAWLNLPETLSTVPLLTVFGLGWLISGLITLRSYLSSTRPAAEGSDA